MTFDMQNKSFLNGAKQVEEAIGNASKAVQDFGEKFAKNKFDNWISGAADAGRAMADLEKATRRQQEATANLGQVLPGASRRMSDLNDSTKETAGTFDGAKETIKNFAAGFTAAELAIKGVRIAIDAIKGSWESLKSFESANVSLGAVTGLTGSALDKLKDSAKEFGEASIFSASQVTELQTSLSKFGYAEEEVIKMTQSLINLSTVAGMAPAKAAQEVGMMMKMFGDGAEDIKRYTESLGYMATKTMVDINSLTMGMARFAPIAQSMNMGFEDVLAMLAKLSESGIKGSRAMMSLNSIFTKIQQSKVHGFVDLKGFDDFIFRMQEISKKADFTKVLSKDLGPTASIFLPLVKAAGDAENGIVAVRDRLVEMGKGGADGLDDMAGKMTNTVNGAVSMLSSSWERFVLEIGESSLAPVKDTVNLISAALGELTKMVNGDFDKISESTYYYAGAVGVLVTGLVALKAESAGMSIYTANQVANYEALEAELTKTITLQGGEMDATLKQAVAKGQLTEAQAVAIQSMINETREVSTNMQVKMASLEVDKKKAIAENKKAKAEMETAEAAMKKAEAETEAAYNELRAAEEASAHAEQELKLAKTTLDSAKANKQKAKSAEEAAVAQERLANAEQRYMTAQGTAQNATKRVTTASKAYREADQRVGLTSAQEKYQERRTNYQDTFKRNQPVIAATNKQMKETGMLLDENNKRLKNVGENLGAAGNQAKGFWANIGRGLASFGKSLASFFLNPLMIAIGVIAAVKFAIDEFKGAENSAADGIKAVNAEMEAYNRNQEQCMSKTRELVGVLNDENKSMVEKYEAYEKMKEMYKSLGNMSWEQFQSLSPAEQEKVLKNAQLDNDEEHARKRLELIQKVYGYYEKRGDLDSSSTYHDVKGKIEKYNQSGKYGLTEDEVKALQENIEQGNNIGDLLSSMIDQETADLDNVLFKNMANGVTNAMEMLKSSGIPKEIADSFNGVKAAVSDVFTGDMVDGRLMADVDKLEKARTQIEGQYDLFNGKLEDLRRQRAEFVKAGKDTSDIDKQIKSYEAYTEVLQRQVTYYKELAKNSDAVKARQEALRKEEEKLEKIRETGTSNGNDHDNFALRIKRAKENLEYLKAVGGNDDRIREEEKNIEYFESLWKRNLEYQEKKVQEAKEKLLSIASLTDAEREQLNIALGINIDPKVKAELQLDFDDVVKAAQDTTIKIEEMTKAGEDQFSISVEEATKQAKDSFSKTEESYRQSSDKIKAKIKELEAEAEKWAGTPKEADIRADITQAKNSLAQLEAYYTMLKVIMSLPIPVEVKVSMAKEEMDKLQKAQQSLQTATERKPDLGDPNQKTTKDLEGEAKARAKAEREAESKRKKAEAKRKKEEAEAKRKAEKVKKATEDLEKQMKDETERLEGLTTSLIEDGRIKELQQLTDKMNKDLQDVNERLKKAEKLAKEAGKALTQEQKRVFESQREKIREGANLQYAQINVKYDRQEMESYISYLSKAKDELTQMGAEQLKRQLEIIQLQNDPTYRSLLKALDDNEKMKRDISGSGLSEEDKVSRMEALDLEDKIIRARLSTYEYQERIIEKEWEYAQQEAEMAKRRADIDWVSTFEGMGEVQTAVVENALRRLTSWTAPAGITEVDQTGFGNDRAIKFSPSFASGFNGTVEEFKETLDMISELEDGIKKGASNIDFKALGQDVGELFSKRADLRVAREAEARENEEINEMSLDNLKLKMKIRKDERNIQNLDVQGEDTSGLRAQLDADIKRAAEMDVEIKQRRENNEMRKEENDKEERFIIEHEHDMQDNARRLRQSWGDMIGGIKNIFNASDLTGLHDGLLQLSDGIGKKIKVKGEEKSLEEIIDKPFNKMAKEAGKLIGGSVGGVIGEMGADAIFQVLDILSQGLENLIANLLEMVINSLTGIVKTLTDPEVWVEAMKGVGKAFQNLLKAMVKGSFFGLGGKIFSMDGNAREVAEREEKLSKVADSLRRSLDSLRDEIKSGEGFKSVTAYNEAVETAREDEEVARLRMLNQAGYHNAHHSLTYELNKLGGDQWARISELTGESVRNSADLFSLSADNWKKIVGDAELFWEIQQHGSSVYWENLMPFIDEYVGKAGQIEEMSEALRESLTQISFDSFYDSFVSTLMQMDADSEDFAENFSEYLMKAVLTNQIGELLKGELEDFYKEWAERSKDGLTGGEIADLQNMYGNIVDKGIQMRDDIAKITGYDQSTSATGSSKGVGSMTQDTAEELNGRFTALQIAGESIRSGVWSMMTTLSMISTYSLERNAILAEFRNIAISSNSYLADIAKYNKSIYVDFSDKLDKIINNTSNI